MLNIQRITQHLTRNVFKSLYSSSSATQTLTDKIIEKKNDDQTTKIKNPIVAAAFASLTDDPKNTVSLTETSTSKSLDLIDIDERIINAKTVNGLLKIGETNANISRKHALKMVSILAEWSSINKAKISEFENDARFLKLCRILGRTVPKGTTSNTNTNSKINGFRTDDLNTVLGITGDDEAAKMIANISLPQMVKVMSTLALKKRRSTPLLRSLSYNISRNSNELNLKHCADLLYAMAVLNFPDPVLTSRICSEIHVGLQKNEKPAVVGSILTSLSLLKYRDTDALEALTSWILSKSDLCRPQDISALFMTLAYLNYKPIKCNDLEKNLADVISHSDFKKSADWLSHVWAMVSLGIAKPHHIESVLKKEFLAQLETEYNNMLTPTLKMKLLNINAAAKLLISDYKGVFLLKDTDINVLPIKHSKTKQILVSGISDAIKTLVSSPALIQTHYDTNMGFVIDAVCIFDSKFNPLPLNKVHPNATKIAIMALDFHDMCQGSTPIINGIMSLAIQLLEKSGYKTITVPYNEFNPNEKLLKRVQYIEMKLKEIVNKK